VEETHIEAEKNLLNDKKEIKNPKSNITLEKINSCKDIHKNSRYVVKTIFRNNVFKYFITNQEMMKFILMKQSTEEVPKSAPFSFPPFMLPLQNK
jgi:hypothetical protein